MLASPARTAAVGGRHELNLDHVFFFTDTSILLFLTAAFTWSDCPGEPDDDESHDWARGRVVPRPSPGRELGTRGDEPVGIFLSQVPVGVRRVPR